MVCYARPVARLAALLLVVFAVFGKPVRGFFGTADAMAAVIVAVAVAAVVAAVAVAVSLAVRRRRAAAGGCVTCRFQCQHAMTQAPPPPAPAQLRGPGRPAAGHPGPAARRAAGRPAAAPDPAWRPLLPIQPVARQVFLPKDLDRDRDRQRERVRASA